MNGEANSLIWNKFFHLLTYQPNEAFVFSGLEFWILFGFFLGVFSLTYRNIKIRNLIILGFSLFFYYKSSGLAVLLLLFTITEDFIIARYLNLTEKKSVRKLLITISIVSNLVVLSYFKYTFFFIDTINDLFSADIEKRNWLATLVPENPFFNLDVHSILLPVGISFFTFQSLSYTIDVYRGLIKPLKSWFDFAFFVTFFPQLVAGPIVRARDFVGQIFKPYQVDQQTFGKGVYLILGGLIKKIVMSDIVSTQLVDRVFDQPGIASSIEAWIGIYGYGLQIFCDFSGYTDIAIGLALVLGFQLNPNFDQPYKSLSVTEFWRRWHISLSVWLRDYLYIPLGGNRLGTTRTYFNLMITMLLGGLWHGANLKFILWGGLHGLALAIHKIWVNIGTKLRIRIPDHLAWFLTFHFAIFCWIPFRAADLSNVKELILKLLSMPDFTLLQPVMDQYKLPILILCIGFLVVFTPDKIKLRLANFFSNSSPIALCSISALVVFVIYQFKTAGSQPFIYFQF